MSRSPAIRRSNSSASSGERRENHMTSVAAAAISETQCTPRRLAYARGVAAETSPIVPELPIIRARGEGEHRATSFELFFDLVYVFAVTQLSHHLLADISWSGAAETAFMLVAVYWAWTYTTWMTNWFDPDTVPVRLVLVFVMAASLLLAVAIPDGFGGHALLFACAYAGLQIGRNA